MITHVEKCTKNTTTLHFYLGSISTKNQFSHIHTSCKWWNKWLMSSWMAQGGLCPHDSMTVGADKWPGGGLECYICIWELFTSILSIGCKVYSNEAEQNWINLWATRGVACKIRGTFLGSEQLSSSKALSLYTNCTFCTLSYTVQHRFSRTRPNQSLVTPESAFGLAHGF